MGKNPFNYQEQPEQTQKKPDILPDILSLRKTIDNQLLSPTKNNILLNSQNQRASLTVALNLSEKKDKITPQKIKTAKKCLSEALGFIKKWKKSNRITINGNPFRFNPFFKNPEKYLPLMIKESKLDNNSVSNSGAKGYFQIRENGAFKEVEENIRVLSQKKRKEKQKQLKLSELLPTGYKTPINNCIYGIIFFHYCLEHYAKNPIFNKLSPSDKKSLAYMIYNAGPTKVIMLWKALKPTSYADFENKLLQNLADQLGVQKGKSAKIFDNDYKVYYPEDSAIKKYRELLSKNSDKLKKEFILNGKNTNMSIGKLGEMTRYVRIIQAIENQKQKKPEILSKNKEKLDTETIGQYVKLKDKQYVRNFASMRQGAKRFKSVEWQNHPKWNAKKLVYRKKLLVKNKIYKLKKVKYIILHSTGGETSLETIVKKKAHFVVEKNGAIKYLVHIEGGKGKNKITPHAGISAWNGDEFLNEYSIGIEVVANPPDNWTPQQYQAVKKLVYFLGGHFNLRKRDVLLHKQISYSRRWGRGKKSDPYDNPSVLFQKLALPDNSTLLDLDVANGNIYSNISAIKADNDNHPHGAWDGLKAAIQVSK